MPLIVFVFFLPCLSSHCSALRRQCTICFGDETECPGSEWCRPCRCRGTSRWVHKSCILRWIDEKQKKKGLDWPVKCEQCQVEWHSSSSEIAECCWRHVCVLLLLLSVACVLNSFAFARAACHQDCSFPFCQGSFHYIREP